MRRPALLLLLWLLVPAAGAAPAIPFLEMEAAPPNPYVQQQVTLTLRLYRRSHLERGEFLLPEIPGALLALVGEEEPRPVTRRGERLELVEQRYLLFPQHSGPLVLPAPRFSGRDLFLQGRPLTLQVLPPPAGAPRPWLPARALALSQRWGRGDAPWRVGEPRLRVLTLEARGLTGAQLPALPESRVEGIEEQRVRVEIRERIEDGVMVGSRTEYRRLIPRRPGSLRLPPVTVPWWDTGSGEARTARLPARTVEVIPAAPVPPPPATAIGSPSPRPAVVTDSPAPSSWSWPAVILGGSVLAPALLLLLLRRRLLAGWWRRRQARAALRRACRDHDPEAARRALLRWAGHCPGDAGTITTLPALARRLRDPAAREALLNLDRALYGPEGRWRGDPAWRALAPALGRCGGSHRRPPASPIPPLDPGQAKSRG